MMELFLYPVVLLLFVVIFTKEVIAPSSKNTCDKRWLIIASIIGTGSVLSTLLVGYIFATYIQSIAIFKAGQYMPDYMVGILSFLMTSFIFYWWHRATHHSDILWRFFHQLHHSAKRIEVLTAFFAHPLDTVAAVLIGAFSSYIVLGASPLAVTISFFLIAAFDLFLHSDINTPRWVGYVVQRPEMHTLHHKQGHHAQNYGLPIWDIIFNTWKNNEKREISLGFSGKKSTRITEMLLFKDVHK